MTTPTPTPSSTTTDDDTTLRGTVVHIFKASERWSGGVIRRKDNGLDVKFCGFFFARVGDALILRGSWDEHPKFGRQFKADVGFEYDQDLDREALIAHLSKSPAFKGLGRSRAGQLVDTAIDQFGSWDDAMTGDIDELSLHLYPSIPTDVVYSAAKEWNERRDENLAMTELAKFGVTPGRASGLIKAHGPEVVAIVRSNPYFLIGKVPGFGFGRADEIALRVGVAKDSPERIREAIVFTLQENERNGSTWMPLTDLLAECRERLKLDNVDAQTIITERLYEMFPGAPDFNLPPRLRLAKHAIKVKHGTDVAIWRHYTYHAEVSGMLPILSNANEKSGVELSAQEIELIDFLAGFTLNRAQLAAVFVAVESKVSVITGGAGVGKTTVTKVIRELLMRRGKDVAIVAPTGKAARRASEVVGCETSTIHVLLEPKHISKAEVTPEDIGTDADDLDRFEAEIKREMSFSFSRNRQNPIDADTVVVDEFSMVDVFLFASLVRAIDFRRTSLILIGDHNQLPSVGPGAILRDFCRIEYGSSQGDVGPPVFHLSKVMRQAGELLHNVSGILDGNVAPTSVSPPERDSENATDLLPWYVHARANESAEMSAAMIESIFEKASLHGREVEIGGTRVVIDDLRDVQVLTPIHKGPAGTIELNRIMQRVFQKRNFDIDVPAPESSRSFPKPMVGDKVIWTKNDYSIEPALMNGTIGYVTEASQDKGTLTVQWEDRADPITVKSDKTGLISLAYALTIHKVQGSEFPVAIVVVSKSHHFVHHRGLLYTGVSRARCSAVLIGHPRAMNWCAKEVKAVTRRTLYSTGSAKSILGVS